MGKRDTRFAAANSWLLCPQLLPHHHQSVPQKILAFPFPAVKPVRIVHGQSDAPDAVFHRAFRQNGPAGCLEQPFQLLILRKLRI